MIMLFRVVNSLEKRNISDPTARRTMAAARTLVLLWGILLICCTRSAIADVPTPKVWPVRFYALLFQNYTGELAVMDLWYDWVKGGNLHIIQAQLGSTSYDMSWTNGTSFFWDAKAKTCESVDVGVGILRPNWLEGADYIGVKEINGFTCNVFNKLDFVTYYEDFETRRPVFWKFYTEREVSVITFEEGVALEDEISQAPDYCFSDEQTTSSNINLFHERSKPSVLIEQKEWLLSGAVSA